MQLRPSKSILGLAAAGLIIGVGPTAYGLLQPAPATPPPRALAGANHAGANHADHTFAGPARARHTLGGDTLAGPALTGPTGAGYTLGGPTAQEMAFFAAAASDTSSPQQGNSGPIDRRAGMLRIGGGLREFYFTRGIYTSWRGGYGRRRGSWAVDYPKADVQFMWGLKRLTSIDAYDYENAVQLTDPDLRRYPFLYMLEVGYMQLTPPEVEGLRDYLTAGGFLFIDDFWGTYEWENFQWEIHKVLPGARIVELPLDHPLFHTFYSIEEILQVPNVGNARRGYGTSEQDGYVPHVRAIFDDDERLLVLINWNTDLGDAWEWAEDPYYPLMYSNYAYQVAVNAIIYAMNH